MFGTVSVCAVAEVKKGGGGPMNRKTGLLLCSPHCCSFPSCFAFPLTELYGLEFGARSLTLMPTATVILFFFFFW